MCASSFTFFDVTKHKLSSINPIADSQADMYTHTHTHTHTRAHLCGCKKWIQNEIEMTEMAERSALLHSSRNVSRNVMMID